MKKKHRQASIYTRLYWLIQDKKLDPKILLDFIDFFWPKFIKKDGYIFLKENFSEEEYNLKIQGKVNPEYWMNLLTVDDFFTEISGGERKSIDLAKGLVQIWKVKLKHDFPTINFNVEYLYDNETGDYGLTFYQRKTH